MNIQHITHAVRVCRQRWAELPPLLKPAIPLLLGAAAIGAVYRELTVSQPSDAMPVPADAPTSALDTK